MVSQRTRLGSGPRRVYKNTRAILTGRAVLLLQLCTAAVAVALAALLGGAHAGISAAAGGGISVLVTAFFAGRVFAPGPGSSAARVARAFFVAEVLKLVLTGALFAAAIVLLQAMFLPLILTYIVTLMAFWLVLPLNLGQR